MTDKTSRLLTLAALEARGACAEQVALFRDLFGESVNVTETLCAEHATRFAFGWAAQSLLTAPAYAVYEAAMAPADADYEAARAPADADYEAAMAPADAAYEAARAPAYAVYEAAMAPADAAYRAARAPAFARAYIGDVA